MTILYSNIAQLVQPHVHEDSRTPVEITNDAALLVKDGVVIAAGEQQHVKNIAKQYSAEEINLRKRTVLPGLIDSHTHAVFAGQRLNDFSRRTRGETYEQIAKAGGGILDSVEQLQHASDDQLLRYSLKHLELLLKKGTTTCEIKSGYGLSFEHEFRQLKTIAKLKQFSPLSLHATVLAHAIPKNVQRDTYVKMFCEQLLPQVATQNLAEFCDIFVDQHAFLPNEAMHIAEQAKNLNLKMKLHADQLTDGNGATLASQMKAISADHLELVSEQGCKNLAHAKVVATILPGCAAFLGKGPWPQGRTLRDAGCEVAVATDFNPGSSHIVDLALCGALAATRCGLTLEEALWGITRGGAKALDLHDRGCLRVNERADFIVLDDIDWRNLFYCFGFAPIHSVYIKGQQIL